MQKMKSLRLTVAALATAALAVTFSAPSSVAQTTPAPTTPAPTTPAPTTPTPAAADQTAQFGMQETDQAPYILVAQPTSRLGGAQRYGLMIIEQKRAEPACFSTTGTRPTQVNVLLLNFDFTGICSKATDTNGYIIRVANTDIAYDPVIEAKDGVLVLYGIPRRAAGANARPIILGQTDGIAANGFTKITLNSGWRLARQTYNNSVTGRTYLANNSTLAQLVEQAGGVVVAQPPTNPAPNPTPTPPPAAPSFGDVQGDIYANAINRAVQLGFISGFPEDNTFRPRSPLTREQLVSMVVDALKLPDRPPVTGQYYSDVPPSRWSATKIEQARDLGLISGYEDRTFKPTQNVTRAELMAITRRAAEYRSRSTQLAANQTGVTFSDIQGHWAQSVITSMSTYCGVATPLNETGSNFAPNTPAQRNYAAAALVRLVDCSQTLPR
jgi:N-acetylmuramoyl-L-alanine amidase